MLMVFEIAPEMNGCAAAIMRMCDSADRNRLPFLPHLLAQSNTGQVLGPQVRAPSTVIVPHTYSLASAIWARVKPR